jgi:hypothetical protein
VARTPTKPDASKGGARERPPEDTKGNDDIPFGETKVPSLPTSGAGGSDETGDVDDTQAVVVPDDTNAADADITTDGTGVASDAVDDAQHAIIPDDSVNPTITSKSVIDDGNESGAAPSPFGTDPSLRLANTIDPDVEFAPALPPEPDIPTIEDQPANLPDPTDPIG